MLTSQVLKLATDKTIFTIIDEFSHLSFMKYGP